MCACPRGAYTGRSSMSRVLFSGCPPYGLRQPLSDPELWAHRQGLWGKETVKNLLGNAVQDLVICLSVSVFPENTGLDFPAAPASR